MMLILDAMYLDSVRFFRALAILMLAVVCAAKSWAAYPTAVNTQITDAVTQANVQVLGSSPALAMGSLYEQVAKSLAAAANNATINQQQSTLTAQAATTMGVATLYSLDTASTGIATKTILGASGLRTAPAAMASLLSEGILGGVSLLMFNLEGNNSPFADYYVISDQGFDYYVDSDENLIMYAHQIRTFGDAPFPATDLGFLLPPSSVATYFPELLESSPSGSMARGSDGSQANGQALRDIYFGVKYADGTTTFYEGSLSRPFSVPEPASMGLTFMGLSIMLLARRR